MFINLKTRFCLMTFVVAWVVDGQTANCGENMLADVVVYIQYVGHIHGMQILTQNIRKEISKNWPLSERQLNVVVHELNCTSTTLTTDKTLEDVNNRSGQVNHDESQCLTSQKLHDFVQSFKNKSSLVSFPRTAAPKIVFQIVFINDSFRTPPSTPLLKYTDLYLRISNNIVSDTGFNQNFTKDCANSDYTETNCLVSIHKLLCKCRYQLQYVGECRLVDGRCMAPVEVNVSQTTDQKYCPTSGGLLYCEKIDGCSPTASIEQFSATKSTTNGERKRLESSGKRGKVLLVAAIVGVVLVLLAILAVVLFKRRKRRRDPKGNRGQTIAEGQQKRQSSSIASNSMIIAESPRTMLPVPQQQDSTLQAKSVSRVSEVSTVESSTRSRERLANSGLSEDKFSRKSMPSGRLVGASIHSANRDDTSAMGTANSYSPSTKSNSRSQVKNASLTAPKTPAKRTT